MSIEDTCRKKFDEGNFSELERKFYSDYSHDLMTVRLILRLSTQGHVMLAVNRPTVQNY